MSSSPKVIGFVPIYQAEAFLLKTLEALANQTYPNFEIILCDDASTDGTWEICRDFCNRDSRFSLIRNSQNKGWFATSEMLWLDIAKRSEYCFISPHDDIRYPGYITELVKLLEQNPHASLAIPGMENEYWNETTRSFYTDASDIADVVERCFRIAKKEEHHWWAAYHGMYRSQFVSKIYPIKKLSFGESEFSLDLIVILKMAFFGEFVTSNQVLFKKHYRKNSVSNQWTHTTKNKMALWLAIFTEIRNSPLTHQEKKELKQKLNSLLIRRMIHRIAILSE